MNGTLRNLELFYDYGDLGQWYRFSEVIEEKVSKWQTIRVLKHSKLGKTLILDTNIMGSEYDQEYDSAIISLVPKHKNILILGGGDCSLASRLSKIDNIEKITICDIDPEVPEICKKHFPITLNEKISFVFEDAFKFIQTTKAQEYDAIIDDMFTEPHNSKENYWVDLAKTFKGRWIVSQTDGHFSGVPKKALKVLKDAGAQVQQIERFIPTYTENWTFTLYQYS